MNIIKMIPYYRRREQLITDITNINVQRGITIANQLLPSLTNKQLTGILEDIKRETGLAVPNEQI